MADVTTEDLQAQERDIREIFSRLDTVHYEIGMAKETLRRVLTVTTKELLRRSVELEKRKSEGGSNA